MSSPFADVNGSFFPFNGGLFDLQDVAGGGDHGGTLGFMDMLGRQDFSPSLSNSTPIPFRSTLLASAPSVLSEMVNLPATPNSSTISSSSTEGGNEVDIHVISAGDDDMAEPDQGKKTGTASKEGKKGQKRQREPRFAFVTKSEVDNLEDGYRWRKYGQKAVKNSPFPRSYYRCTSALCGVKKRVERSSKDPTVVVTTYEGKHTHHNPVAPRGSQLLLTNSTPPSAVTAAFLPPAIGDVQGGLQNRLPVFNPFLLSSKPSDFRRPFSGAPPPCSWASTAAAFSDDRRYSMPSTAKALRDHGLLQDLIPSELYKEDQ
ncbi:hypothetical protein HPP92_001077 [Vanilla planifolia]|uniref:WRKY domain-containing protein n=1 Tax=Vanilla planifolia TaxID=51239 RepID=A0A835RYM4_VANPL|nr:hypothetical protein HPP92_001077 [Vanilla planifolia]